MRIDGMGIGAGGVSSVTARGVVYHLNQVDDLNRQYTALGAGVEVGRGANRLRMRTANGVANFECGVGIVIIIVFRDLPELREVMLTSALRIDRSVNLS